MYKGYISFCRLLSFLILFCFTNNSFAQKRNTPINIKIEKNDTLKFYKNIKKVAYKRKFTKFMFHAIFVDPAPLKYEKKPLSDKQKKEDPNLKYSGCIIRNIEIVVLDPFGYSVNDTSLALINPLQSAANKTHIKTSRWVVKNRLLFKKNERIEVLKITESERLLRQARFINDARIFLTNTDQTDSVDVLVVVHDKWTIDPSISAGPTGGSIRLRDRNLIGMGHTFEQRIGYNVSTGYSLRGNYNFSNIRNTYISSDVFYYNSKVTTELGVSFERLFYSPLAKYAGGVLLMKTWGTFNFYDSVSSVNTTYNLDFINSDVWVAKSYRPSKGKSINSRSSSIIGALRFADTRFQAKPDYTIDTAKTNVSSSLYLGSLGFSFRKYYKDQFIYRFGANEDVPEGLMVQLVHGYLRKELQTARNYTGIEISQGKHYDKLGYLSGNVSYGTFYKTGEKNNTTFNAGFYYFSNLSLERRWYVRQFVSGKFTTGFNKPLAERITLNSREMFGFNAGTLTGTGKVILNFETVAYSPYNIIGFKFAPVAFIGLGMLQTPASQLFESKLYQAYSIGLLVRNESLLNSSFEITFGAYPNQPGFDHAVYKLNPVTSFTLKVRSFEISKPSPVGYE
jgi:hypothetical protein